MADGTPVRFWQTSDRTIGSSLPTPNKHRLKQHLAISHHSHPEQKQGPLCMCGLKQAEWCYKKRLFPTAKY
jgi:hypothetical protein